MELPKGKYYVSNIKDYCSTDDISINHIDNLVLENLYNGKQWDYYRLSDTVRFKNHNNSNEQIHTKWPNSIIDLFMNDKNIKYNARNNKLKRICFIINNYFPIKISQPYIAIHLRVGDAIDYMSKPLSFYDDLDVSKFSCNNAIIFCGLHNHRHKEQSLIYIKKVYKILESKKLNIILRCGNNPDDDFVLMVKSSHFIESGGGYSHTVSEVIQTLQHNN